MVIAYPGKAKGLRAAHPAACNASLVLVLVLLGWAWMEAEARRTLAETSTNASHKHSSSASAISPDGARLASATWDGTVQVYLLRTEDLVALARSRVTRTLTDEELGGIHAYKNHLFRSAADA